MSAKPRSGFKLARGLCPDNGTKKVSFQVNIRPEAEADLAEGFSWYESHRDGLGLEFLEEVRKSIKAITENPNRFSIKYRNTRRALIRRFPYQILYFIEADVVEVFAVIHVRRNPELWQQRI